MEKDKYTEDGLPIVCDKIIDVSLRDDERYIYEGVKVNKTYDHIKEILEAENPIMLEFLDIWIDEFHGDLNSDAFVMGFAGAYKLLKRQAQANKLEESLE